MSNLPQKGLSELKVLCLAKSHITAQGENNENRKTGRTIKCVIHKWCSLFQVWMLLRN